MRPVLNGKLQFVCSDISGWYFRFPVIFIKNIRPSKEVKQVWIRKTGKLKKCAAFKMEDSMIIVGTCKLSNIIKKSSILDEAGFLDFMVSGSRPLQKSTPYVENHYVKYAKILIFLWLAFSEPYYSNTRNTSHRKPVFLHILRSESQMFYSILVIPDLLILLYSLLPKKNKDVPLSLCLLY